MTSFYFRSARGGASQCRGLSSRRHAATPRRRDACRSAERGERGSRGRRGIPTPGLASLAAIDSQSDYSRVIRQPEPSKQEGGLVFSKTLIPSFRGWKIFHLIEAAAAGASSLPQRARGLAAWRSRGWRTVDARARWGGTLTKTKKYARNNLGAGRGEPAAVIGGQSMPQWPRVAARGRGLEAASRAVTRRRDALASSGILNVKRPFPS